MLIKPVRSGLAASALIALSMLACARAPSRPATTYEDVMAYNAALAEANLALAKAVITTQEEGLLTKEQAESVLNAQYLIAKQHKELTALLQLGPEGAKRNEAAIRAFLDSIQAALDRQIQSGILPPKLGPVVEIIKLITQALLRDLRLVGVID